MTSLQREILTTTPHKLTWCGFVRGGDGYHTSEALHNICMYVCTVHLYVHTHVHALMDGSTNIYTLLTFTPPIYHLPYRLTLSVGTTRDYPGSSCKHILEFLNATCNKTENDGPYWITIRDECPQKEQTIQVNKC